MKALMFAIAVLFPTQALAQAFDPQVRLLMHHHVIEPTHKLGIATWTIVPDVTDHNLTTRNPKRLLFVGGLIVRSNTSTDYNWLEIMAGALFEADTLSGKGKVIPLLNIRSYLKWQKADLYLEEQNRKNLLLLSTFATAPIGRRFNLRLGVETEAIIGLDEKTKNRLSVGPRASIRLYWSWLPLAEALLIDQDGNLVPRTYLKFGK